MGNKISLIKSLRIACIEYYKWIVNPRMIIAVSMIIFVWNFAVFPLVEISKEMNSPLNAFEPFIAILNSRVLCLVTPSVYLFLISDYPRLDKNSLFIINRLKKSEWVIGQFLFFLFSSFTYLSSIFLSSLLPNAANSFFADGWSLTITRYGLYFPEKASGFAATLITKELYNQITPYKSVMIGFMLTLLYMILIAMIILFFHILNLLKVSIPAVVSIIAIGSALGIAKSSGMWFFPMAHTMINLHFTEYFRKPIMELKYSFLYFIGLITVILIVCLLAVKHTNFLNIDEND